MSNSFKDLSSAEVIDTIDRIYHNVATLFTPPLFDKKAGWGFHDEGDICWLRTYPPSEYPNWVFDTRFTETNVDQRISEIVERIKAGELPSIWALGPSSTPANLSQKLKKNGFEFLAGFPGMAYDLEQLDEHSIINSSLRLPEDSSQLYVHEITTDEEFEDWARVNIMGFHEYFHSTGCEVKIYSKLRDKKSAPFVKFYGAWLDRKMVGAAQAVFYPTGFPCKLVELHQCSVVPDYRKMGIARQLVTKPLLDARQEGYSMSSFFAEAKAADPFWVSIGFKTYCEFEWYVFNHDASSD